MVGRDARVTGGLRRHGGNRPLPLHKVMDSGNKGYASPAERCRPGGPSSRKSHRKAGFGAWNGGKQARFRFEREHHSAAAATRLAPFAAFRWRTGAVRACFLPRHDRVRLRTRRMRASGSNPTSIATSTSRRRDARKGHLDATAPG
ncbi:hypothetical protein SLUN_26760 [Streptomyces lunaelactis]|uniref:Uncharacterized protein n=1 Tax=Streptomyces lunaelactis TaxID=1535768 RepID=A0A2R4T7Z5_9ACTN|nr:hypothetical protein SLUN_26760 [Streptomyces lunaelactis]